MHNFKRRLEIRVGRTREAVVRVGAVGDGFAPKTSRQPGLGETSAKAGKESADGPLSFSVLVRGVYTGALTTNVVLAEEVGDSLVEDLSAVVCTEDFDLVVAPLVKGYFDQLSQDVGYLGFLLDDCRPNETGEVVDNHESVNAATDGGSPNGASQVSAKSLTKMGGARGRNFDPRVTFRFAELT